MAYPQPHPHGPLHPHGHAHTCNLMCPHSHAILPWLHLGAASAVPHLLATPGGLHGVLSVCTTQVSMSAAAAPGRLVARHAVLPLSDAVDEPLLAHLDTAVNFLLQRAGRPTLVHCHHGQSRSAAITVAVLMIVAGLPLDTAHAYVAACRPCIAINGGFLAQLALLDTMLRGVPRRLPYLPTTTGTTTPASITHATTGTLSRRPSSSTTPPPPPTIDASSGGGGGGDSGGAGPAVHAAIGEGEGAAGGSGSDASTPGAVEVQHAQQAAARYRMLTAAATRRREGRTAAGFADYIPSCSSAAAVAAARASPSFFVRIAPPPPPPLSPVAADSLRDACTAAFASAAAAVLRPTAPGTAASDLAGVMASGYTSDGMGGGDVSSDDGGVDGPPPGPRLQDMGGWVRSLLRPAGRQGVAHTRALSLHAPLEGDALLLCCGTCRAVLATNANVVAACRVSSRGGTVDAPCRCGAVYLEPMGWMDASRGAAADGTTIPASPMSPLPTPVHLSLPPTSRDGSCTVTAAAGGSSTSASTGASSACASASAATSASAARPPRAATAAGYYAHPIAQLDGCTIDDSGTTFVPHTPSPAAGSWSSWGTPSPHGGGGGGGATPSPSPPAPVETYVHMEEPGEALTYGLRALRPEAGKLVCPVPTCGAKVGSYTWAGTPCTGSRYCGPVFLLHRERTMARAALGSPSAAVAAATAAAATTTATGTTAAATDS